MLIGTGFAPDGVKAIYRPLSVKRSDVEELWQPVHGALAKSNPIKRFDLPKHRPAAELAIRAAARGLYQRPGKPPNMNEAGKALMKMFPGTSRDGIIRKILAEEEFAKQRLNAGNQPKS